MSMLNRIFYSQGWSILTSFLATFVVAVLLFPANQGDFVVIDSELTLKVGLPETLHHIGLIVLGLSLLCSIILPQKSFGVERSAKFRRRIFFFQIIIVGALVVLNMVTR